MPLQALPENVNLSELAENLLVLFFLLHYAGMNTMEGVVMLASTNRQDILDQVNLKHNSNTSLVLETRRWLVNL